MPVIQLSRGYAAEVDAVDYERFGHLNWTADVQVATPDYEKVYAARWVWQGPGLPRPKIYLHRAIVEPEGSLLVDHRDGNGLNCRRNNLRVATHKQNSHNIFRALGANRFRGVNFDRGRWRVRVTRKRADGTREYLYSKYHDSQHEAAHDYDRAVLRLYGEFAATNFPRAIYTTKRPVVVHNPIPF